MKPTEVVRRVHVEKLLEKAEGKFITVHFQKLDRSMRKMNGRFGVNKGVKGTGKSIASSSNPYKTLYDIPKKGFRTINLETITEIAMCGKIYKIEG